MDSFGIVGVGRDGADLHTLRDRAETFKVGVHQNSIVVALIRGLVCIGRGGKFASGIARGPQPACAVRKGCPSLRAVNFAERNRRNCCERRIKFDVVSLLNIEGNCRVAVGGGEEVPGVGEAGDVGVPARIDGNLAYVVLGSAAQVGPVQQPTAGWVQLEYVGIRETCWHLRLERPLAGVKAGIVGPVSDERGAGSSFTTKALPMPG